jgi:hypothetical protein
MKSTLEKAAQKYLSNFEIIDGKICNKWIKCEITLEEIKEAYHDGFAHARETSEPLSLLINGLEIGSKDEKLSHEMVLMNSAPSVPLSPDKYMVCVFEEHIERPPHIHVIIPEKLNIAYDINNNRILGIIEGENADLRSLTKEVVAWFALPNKAFGTNREACSYQFRIQTYSEGSLLTHQSH